MPPTKTKLVMLGMGGVGKSCVTWQFINRRFAVDYVPTIEDVFERNLIVDGVSYAIEVTDTAGQELFEPLRDRYIRLGDGFMCLYAINDKQSFEDIHRLVNSVRTMRGNEISILVVANKHDLEHQRVVPEEAGRKFAKENNCGFIETSAKTAYNVEAAYTQLVRICGKGATGGSSKKGDKKSPCVLV